MNDVDEIMKVVERPFPEFCATLGQETVLKGLNFVCGVPIVTECELEKHYKREAARDDEIPVGHLRNE